MTTGGSSYLINIFFCNNENKIFLLELENFQILFLVYAVYKENHHEMEYGVKAKKYIYF